MSFESTSLRRRLFGYQTEQVERLLADREGQLLQSEGRLRAVEARVAELEEQLAEAREQAASREAASGSAKFLSEELTTILTAAEEAASRILERATSSTHQRVQDADKLWRDVQAEITRFASWRERLDPALHSAQSRFDEVRAEVEEVPERIRRALAPMADAIAAMNTDLANLAGAFNPPLLLAPSGLEERAGIRREPSEAGEPTEGETAKNSGDASGSSEPEGASPPEATGGSDASEEGTPEATEEQSSEASEAAAEAPEATAETNTEKSEVSDEGSEASKSSDKSSEEPLKDIQKGSAKATKQEAGGAPRPLRDIFGSPSAKASGRPPDPPVSDYLPPGMGIA